MVLNLIWSHAACRAFFLEKRLRTCAVRDKEDGWLGCLFMKKKILTPLAWNQD